MYAFFQRLIKNHPKPDLSLYGNCDSYLAYSSAFHLSNGLILSIGGYDSNNQDKKDKTEVLLFDPLSNSKIAEQELSGNYRVVSTLFDNKLLLSDKNNNSLYILDGYALKIIDNIIGDFNPYTNWLPLDNQKFLTIERPTYYNKNAPFSLLIQDLAAKKLNQPASLPLPINEEEAVLLGDRTSISLTNLTQLANGQYACLVLGHNTGYFKVFLFDRNPGAEYEFKVAGIINPIQEAWGFNDNSTPDVSYVGLPNGDVLTYRHSGVDFQVWRGTECIDTWSWYKDVNCNDKVFNQGFWTFQVAPLPDGENLLINSRVKLFMFNMKSHQIQPIDLGKFTPSDVDIGPDGKALVRGQEERHPYQANNMLLVVDFSKILNKNVKHDRVRDTVYSTNENAVTPSIHR